MIFPSIFPSSSHENSGRVPIHPHLRRFRRSKLLEKRASWTNQDEDFKREKWWFHRIPWDSMGFNQHQRRYHWFMDLIQNRVKMKEDSMRVHGREKNAATINWSPHTSKHHLYIYDPIFRAKRAPTTGDHQLRYHGGSRQPVRKWEISQIRVILTA